mgnify:CR=1 FL=1
MRCRLSLWRDGDRFMFFFQAEDGIRDLVRSRGLGDVYKRQVISKLGEGATSEVFLCRDPFNNRQVAIKVVFEDLSLIHI